jgi:hypothetical protein
MAERDRAAQDDNQMFRGTLIGRLGVLKIYMIVP